MQTQLKPLMIFELKPNVSASLSIVSPSDLFQVLLDAFYTLNCIKTKELTVCLTDSVTWHGIF